jgi:hypothetical protein
VAQTIFKCSELLTRVLFCAGCCVQGTLREASDACMLVNRISAHAANNNEHVCCAALCCVQGTLREALDAGMLVNKVTGLHDVPIVLSLVHNVACAMAYLHQVGRQRGCKPGHAKGPAASTGSRQSCVIRGVHCV